MGIVELVLHSVLANADSAFYTFCVTGHRLRTGSFPFGHGDVHMYRKCCCREERTKNLSEHAHRADHKTGMPRAAASSCPSPLQRQVTATLSDLLALVH